MMKDNYCVRNGMNHLMMSALARQLDGIKSGMAN